MSAPLAAFGTSLRWSDLALFWILVLAHLVPVWLFRYVPTQDGPSHLANAVLLRDYRAPGTHHREFFELAFEPFPNWTSHLFLAAWDGVVRPLVAEKMLVTCYIVGFALACRYFLASWAGAGVQLAPLCLLFVFNRCFFLGFYNYCVCLPLVFLILGLCARLPERLSPRSLVALAALFLLAYFTHLVGYLQAALGAVLLVLCVPGRRWFRLLCVGAVLLPSAVFLVDYLVSTGVSISLVAGPMAGKLGGGLGSWSGFTRFWEGLAYLNRDLFTPYEAWSVPIGSAWLFMYGAFALAGLYPRPHKKAGATAPRSRGLPVLFLGLAMVVLYLSVPDDFGRHGSLLKPRLALLPPLLGLALLRPPPLSWLKYALLAGSYALVVAQLACTWTHFCAANAVLDKYTAAFEQFGRDHVLYVVQPTASSPQQPSYLLHASDYYCIDSGSTNLDNYEAETHYFPVRFRAGVFRGRGDWNEFRSYSRQAVVDRILAWESPPGEGSPPDGYQVIYRSGRLTIYGRPIER